MMSESEKCKEKALPAGPEEGGFGMSYDLLHGRAGFLWAALFINKVIGPETIPSDLLNLIGKTVIDGGRAGASDDAMCPLMYRWHGTRGWGAVHGLTRILHVLLHFRLCEEDAEDVKKTLRYMMSKSSLTGNYPSSEGNPRDNMVQRSHGARGMASCEPKNMFYRGPFFLLIRSLLIQIQDSFIYSVFSGVIRSKIFRVGRKTVI